MRPWLHKAVKHFPWTIKCADEIAQTIKKYDCHFAISYVSDKPFYCIFWGRNINTFTGQQENSKSK